MQSIRQPFCFRTVKRSKRKSQVQPHLLWLVSVTIKFCYWMSPISLLETRTTRNQTSSKVNWSGLCNYAQTITLKETSTRPFLACEETGIKCLTYGHPPTSVGRNTNTTDWQNCVVIPVWRVKRSRRDFASCNGTSLLSNLGKKLHKRRITAEDQNWKLLLRNVQYGFRKVKRCAQTTKRKGNRMRPRTPPRDYRPGKDILPCWQHLIMENLGVLWNHRPVSPELKSPIQK